MYTDNLKFGKLPYKHDDRTLHFGNYFSLTAASLPTIPLEVTWYDKVKDFGMMLNDTIGDCAIAGPGHLIQMWTANVGFEVVIPDSVIQSVYSAISGYDPSTGENDNGCVLLDVLKYWKNTGIGGHKIGAFAHVDTKNISLMSAAISLFGGTLNGLALPKTIRGQSTWEITGSFNGDGAPGSLGGHCTASGGYNPKENINETWAESLPAAWGFMCVYLDECWVIFSNDFINGNGLTPNGFNRTQLLTDLGLVTS